MIIDMSNNRGDKRLAPDAIAPLPKRPKAMPSGQAWRYYGEAYIHAETGSKKWRIKFPASAPGGSWERKRQWSDDKSKKSQFQAALTLVEARYSEVCAAKAQADA